MDRTATEATIKVLVSEVRQRLDGAALTAKAAETCAEAGNIDKAVEVVLDIEQVAYDASRLLDDAGLRKPGQR